MYRRMSGEVGERAKRAKLLVRITLVMLFVMKFDLCTYGQA